MEDCCNCCEDKSKCKPCPGCSCCCCCCKIYKEGEKCACGAGNPCETQAS